MTNHIIDVESYRVSFNDVSDNRGICGGNRVRVYRSSPSSVSLQIRGEGPLENGKGGKKKERRMYAHVSLSKQQVADIVSALIEESSEIADEDKNTLIGALLGAA